MGREGRTNTYYALHLDLRGKRCVVVGGGRIAERKTRGLLEGGADRVTLISPAATAALVALAEQGSIQWLRREYQEKDAEGATLVFAATDSRIVNERIMQDARSAGALVNQADEAAEGDFIAPSTVRSGPLLMSVSTSGTSPALAKRIRSELEDRYAEPYAWWAERLGELRATILKEKKLATAMKRAMLQEAAEEAELDLQGVRRSPQRGDETIEAWGSRLQRRTSLDGGVDRI
ncbi:precorrin-2 dehydrogenase/sirohydrochlorin ferrochelatase family protein [Paenibacillus xanthanilyticus]|uniref:precorrin-2 dehydrogenase n=1 Tax=Paenibacillus xanthanilyticus TaxID=1783531 RepID=A0ABV8K1F4_9BACL